MRKQLAIPALIMAISMIPASFADSGVYTIEAEDKSFDVQYSLDGQVIAMDADTQSTSILVGITDVEDSVFEITFPPELLAAENADFIVLVDGLETDYLISYDEDTPTISFGIPALTQEIEIIGTTVVPEFPFGALLTLGAVVSVAMLLAKRRTIFK